MDITILVATMSGTAEMAADVMVDIIEEAGHSADIIRMEKATTEMLSNGGDFIVCSSTYGTGEVPDNGKPFYKAIGDEKPDLSSVTYGVFSLGNSVYPNTFCFGGKRFDTLFQELGAKRVGDVFKHDSSSGEHADDAAEGWIEEWLELRAAQN